MAVSVDHPPRSDVGTLQTPSSQTPVTDRPEAWTPVSLYDRTEDGQGRPWVWE